MYLGGEGPSFLLSGEGTSYLLAFLLPSPPSVESSSSPASELSRPRFPDPFFPRGLMVSRL